jgi:hypothetical protein
MTPAEKRAHREHIASQRKSAAAQERHEKKMLALFKKALRATGSKHGYRTNCSSRSAACTWSGGRSTRGAGSWKSLGKTPPLLLKIHSGGLAGDRYAEKSNGAMLISTNMMGRTAKDRAREFSLDIARHPMVSPLRLIFHVSLSRPEGFALTKDQWKEVVESWLLQIGAQGCNYASTLHTETPNHHCHLTFSRSKPDGSLLTDSNNRWTWRSALRMTERDLGLSMPVIPAPTDAHVPTSDRMVTAQRRAARLNLPDCFINPKSIQSALSNATDLEQFSQWLLAAGIETKQATKNSRVTGLLFQKQGSGQWLSGSSIAREFSLPRVLETLKSNAQSLNSAAQIRQRQQHQQAMRRIVDASTATGRERNF